MADSKDEKATFSSIPTGSEETLIKDLATANEHMLAAAHALRAKLETLPKDETIIEISQPGDEQEPQGMLFKDEEIEKVEPAAPKPKPIRKDKKAPGLFTRYLNRMTTKIDNIFDILDEDKAQPEIADNDEEETEEKA